MKLSFLFLVTHFVAAAADVGTADERGVSPDDYLDVDLIGANDERPIVLADLDTRNRGSSNRLVGQTSLPICSMPKDFECYNRGVPKCCDTPEDLCPVFEPMCDIGSGNYCNNGGYDYVCYPTGGLPACCSQGGFGLTSCPRIKPDCETNRSLPPPYTTYPPPTYPPPTYPPPTYPPTTYPPATYPPTTYPPTTYPPYATLPPYTYPPILPSYCNSVDNDCYRNNGKPSCCGGDPNFPCPPLQPMCDKFNPNNYCRTLDNECYFNGFPSCCLDRDGIDCPMEKPPPELPCELSYVSSDETVEVHYLRG
ncbi:hypothetical protein ACHAWU_006718 [Discostella pseudostelligera]|uniref:Uncharacterized protein n=1 Tax=Discostella pseudostelligera TaxID=259834 RepID=A0ABD3N289_9STRA